MKTAEEQKIYAERREKMIELARPIMEFLADNFDPYAKIEITATGCELLQSEMMSPQIMDYIKD